MTHFKIVTIPALAVVTTFSCGKSNKSSSGSGSSVAQSSSLAVTYPEGMSVSSSSTTAPTTTASDPTSVIYASGSLAIPTSLTMTNLTTADSYDPTQVPPKEKIIDAAKRLKGEADDCLPGYLFNPTPQPSLGCYNQDGDLVVVNRDYTNPSSPTNPQFPMASAVTLKGEACLAAYSRGKIAEVAAIVDQAQTLVEGMICAAYKNNKKQKLPKVNETLSLATILADITGAQVLPPTSDITSPTGAPTPVTGVPPKSMFRFMKADIKRLENTTDRARFISQIVMEVNGEVRDIRLMHMPSLTTGNNDYIGNLTVKTVKVQRDGLASNFENYLDINYTMDLDTSDGGKPRTSYRLYRAEFSHASLKTLGVDPFQGIGQLDLNKGATFTGDATAMGYGKFPTDISNLSQTVNRVEQIDYMGNPITNEGLLAYWKNFGGNYNEAARGLVADRKRESADSTRLVGCAVSGAALGTTLGSSQSIRMAQREKIILKPTGYYHPMGTDDLSSLKINAKCAAGDCQTAPFVYKQCYRQNDAGLYIPANNTDTAKNYDVINLRTNPEVINNRLPPVDGKIQTR